MESAEITPLVERLLDTLDDCLLGQRPATEVLLAAYLAGGHALLEGVPGIGKTLLARSFASCLGVGLKRVQLTPDLMPADLTGTNIFEQNTGTFRLVPGPVFTEMLMADEINRTPPKTQAALLEAMQELQVTIDGVTHPLSPSFFVIATQNPIEFEGTYPLPEAQLDRFLVRVEMALPPAEAELEIYRRAVAGTLGQPKPRDEQDADTAEQAPGTSPEAPAADAAPGDFAAVVTPQEAAALRHAAATVHVDEGMLDYLLRLAGALRRSPHVELGVSPRGALALLAAGRGMALVEGRDFLTPDDLKRLLTAAWGHRILLTAESELEGQTAARVLEGVAAEVEVPH